MTSMAMVGDKLAIITLIIGLVLGVGAGWWLGRPGDETSSPRAVSKLPDGFQEITLSDVGLKLAIRATDQVANLKHDNQKIGYKIVDRYAPSTGAQVDIVTTRVEEFFDLPAATGLDVYRENAEGLSIQKTIDLSLNGWTGLKQLYTAQLGQKRGDGAVIKRPVGNLLRYAIQAPDGRIILLKSNGAFQKYLDAVATNLNFVPIASGAGEAGPINLGSDVELDVAPDASTGTELFDPTNPSQTIKTE